MMKKFEFTLYGVFMGLVYILLIFGPQIRSGDKHNLNIDIPILFIKEGSVIINNYHIHHWLIFLTILMITLLFKEHYILYFIRGFSIVWIIHGLLYDDRFLFDALRDSIDYVEMNTPLGKTFNIIRK